MEGASACRPKGCLCVILCPAGPRSAFSVSWKGRGWPRGAGVRGGSPAQSPLGRDLRTPGLGGCQAQWGARWGRGDGAHQAPGGLLLGVSGAEPEAGGCGAGCAAGGARETVPKPGWVPPSGLLRPGQTLDLQTRPRRPHRGRGHRARGRSRAEKRPPRSLLREWWGRRAVGLQGPRPCGLIRGLGLERGEGAGQTSRRRQAQPGAGGGGGWRGAAVGPRQEPRAEGGGCLLL